MAVSKWLGLYHGSVISSLEAADDSESRWLWVKPQIYPDQYLDGQHKMICCWRRCEYPWIGIACSAKTYSKESLSTMKEELKHSLNKFPSQVLLATEQPATLTPKATSLPPPLLICLFEWTQKCFFKWSSICNHSSALLVPAPGAGLNNAMSSHKTNLLSV